MAGGVEVGASGASGQFVAPSGASGQLSDAAADWVRELIVSGQLAPGTRVRPEAIAEQLGMSATPARESLRTLQAEGFLRLEPRRGFRVAPLTGDDIRDVYLAQAMLAGELAARAARAATDADVAELEALQAAIVAADAAGDATAVEARNHEFHRRIHRLAGAAKIAGVVGILSKYAPRRFYATVDGWQQATIDDHDALIAGIRDRDPEAARAAMRRHILHAGDLLAEVFDRHG